LASPNIEQKNIPKNLTHCIKSDSLTGMKITMIWRGKLQAANFATYLAYNKDTLQQLPMHYKARNLAETSETQKKVFCAAYRPAD